MGGTKFPFYELHRTAGTGPGLYKIQMGGVGAIINLVDIKTSFGYESLHGVMVGLLPPDQKVESSYLGQETFSAFTTMQVR